MDSPNANIAVILALIILPSTNAPMRAQNMYSWGRSGLVKKEVRVFVVLLLLPSP